MGTVRSSCKHRVGSWIPGTCKYCGSGENPRTGNLEILMPRGNCESSLFLAADHFSPSVAQGTSHLPLYSRPGPVSQPTWQND